MSTDTTAAAGDGSREDDVEGASSAAAEEAAAARLAEFVSDEAIDRILADAEVPEYRRLVQAFATWRVMRRQRRTAEASTGPRTYTTHARRKIKTTVGFLRWLADRDTTLGECGQADVEDWLATGPQAC